MMTEQVSGRSESAFGAAGSFVAGFAGGVDARVGLGVGVVLLSIELLVLGLITEGCGPPS